MLTENTGKGGETEFEVGRERKEEEQGERRKEKRGKRREEGKGGDRKGGEGKGGEGKVRDGRGGEGRGRRRLIRQPSYEVLEIWRLGKCKIFGVDQQAGNPGTCSSGPKVICWQNPLFLREADSLFY